MPYSGMGSTKCFSVLPDPAQAMIWRLPSIDSNSFLLRPSKTRRSFRYRTSCSVQLQAQNKHSRGLKLQGSAFILQAAFGDTNIVKDRPVYSLVSSQMRHHSSPRRNSDRSRTVLREIPALVSAAEAHFGGWGKALYGAGIYQICIFVASQVAQTLAPSRFDS